MKSTLFRFPDAQPRDPQVAAWFAARPDALGELARRWFAALRESDVQVCELLHDGHPTACIQSAAFGEVNAFTAHVNLGFFRGAELPDPNGLLQGTGKLMRHVKLHPGQPVDEAALQALIHAAVANIRRHLAREALAAAGDDSAMFHLDPAHAEDLESLVALRIDVMRESLTRIGRFDAQRARERFAANFDAAATRWVRVGDERAGFVVTRIQPDALLLDHLYVAQAWQGLGLGARVLQQVIREADALRLPVRVGALRGSDSNRFYQRHGFKLVESGEFDHYYLRPCAAVA